MCRYYIGRCAHITWGDVHVLHGKMCTYYIGRCTLITWGDVHIIHGKMCRYYIGRCGRITWEDVLHICFKLEISQTYESQDSAYMIL